MCVVWPARPSHLIAGPLAYRLGGLASQTMHKVRKIVEETGHKKHWQGRVMRGRKWVL